jgi:hypothetical protein
VCCKCGQQHENKQCTVDKPKCANCKGEHPSSSKTCPKKIEKLLLPLGLFAGFRVFISTLACCGVHFSTNTFFIDNNFSIFLGQVLLLEGCSPLQLALNPINMETSSIDLSLVDTSIGPHCTWYVDQKSTHGSDHFVVTWFLIFIVEFFHWDIITSNINQFIG